MAASARSAIVAETDFHGRPSLVKNTGGVTDDSMHGKGWRAARIGGSAVSGGSLVVDLRENGLNLDRGAFEFTLIRGDGQQQDEEAIFTLLGENELEPLFILSLIERPDGTDISSGGLLSNETAFQNWVKGAKHTAGIRVGDGVHTEKTSPKGRSFALPSPGGPPVRQQAVSGRRRHQGETFKELRSCRNHQEEH